MKLVLWQPMKPIHFQPKQLIKIDIFLEKFAFIGIGLALVSFALYFIGGGQYFSNKSLNSLLVFTTWTAAAVIVITLYRIAFLIVLKIMDGQRILSHMLFAGIYFFASCIMSFLPGYLLAFTKGNL